MLLLQMNELGDLRAPFVAQQEGIQRVKGHSPTERSHLVELYFVLYNWRCVTINIGETRQKNAVRFKKSLGTLNPHFDP
jgi:hypothetical protein